MELKDPEVKPLNIKDRYKLMCESIKEFEKKSGSYHKREFKDVKWKVMFLVDMLFKEMERLDYNNNILMKEIRRLENDRQK